MGLKIVSWNLAPSNPRPEKDPGVPHISLVFCEMWDTTALAFNRHELTDASSEGRV
jgi:hypothetical protein